MNYLLYLDPGSGSYLVQALVAGALGIVFFFKNIITYIRGFFGLLTGKKKAVESLQKPMPDSSANSEHSTDK